MLNVTLVQALQWPLGRALGKQMNAVNAFLVERDTL